MTKPSSYHTRPDQPLTGREETWAEKPTKAQQEDAIMGSARLLEALLKQVR